ncbi:MAG: hypothetical protein ACTSRX_02810, partial [Promethearchaeota archaeon]
KNNRNLEAYFMNIWDWELEIEHVIYLFIGAFTWLGLSLWSNFALNIIYDPLPAAIQTFTVVCFWIGGGGILFGIILIIITAGD